MGAAQHYTHVPGVAHWASIKQALALVREGDTHPPKEKEKKEKARDPPLKGNNIGKIPNFLSFRSRAVNPHP